MMKKMSFPVLFLGVLTLLAPVLVNIHPAQAQSLPFSGNNNPEKCEELWKKMIEYSLPGNFETYRMTTTMTSPQFSQKTVMISKTIIKESNDEKLVTTSESSVNGRSNPTTTNTTTRVQFIKMCSTPMTTQPPEILAEGDEKVTVPAGTFDCHFKKIKMPFAGPGAPGNRSIITKSFTTKLSSGSDIMVKSESEMELMPGMKQSTVQELMEFHRGSI